ncbi:hypothetical protein HPB50_028828 [Hyalomma asiaticum]|nr:hypothetical protein HPB50_028828 [Hyalomma asiaticum]
MNRLLECFLMEFEDLDDEAQLRNPDATKQEHVDGFINLVRSCGVKFSSRLKKKDVLKKIHHSTTNEWNAAADALRLAKRLDSHSGSNRVRAYFKEDAEYWFGGGIEASRGKRARSAPDGPSTCRATPADCDVISTGEPQTELAVLGVHTGAENVDTLKRMSTSELARTLTKENVLNWIPTLVDRKTDVIDNIAPE